MKRVRIDHVDKKFGDVQALRQVTLQVAPGEFFTLLGPSGCGKTTLLRLIAGFIRQDQGHIYFDETLMDPIPPHQRDAGMVFQNYALFPHLSVSDNVAYGLRARKIPPGEVQARVRRALEMVQLEGLDARMPGQLSGGQQQRVAVARALVIEPGVVLMDEPLSNLDAKLRIEVRKEIRALQETLGITTIYVTHDQEEALVLSDRVAVMNAGRVLQVGTPQEIYEQPADRFVAGFVGGANFIPAAVRAFDERSGVLTLAVGQGESWRAAGSLRRPSTEVVLSVRPDAFRLASDADDPASVTVLDVAIMGSAYLGAVIECTVVSAGGSRFVVKLPSGTLHTRPRAGDRLRLAVAAGDVRVFPAGE